MGLLAGGVGVGSEGGPRRIDCSPRTINVNRYRRDYYVNASGQTIGIDTEYLRAGTGMSSSSSSGEEDEEEHEEEEQKEVVVEILEESKKQKVGRGG